MLTSSIGPLRRLRLLRALLAALLVAQVFALLITGGGAGAAPGAVADEVRDSSDLAELLHAAAAPVPVATASPSPDPEPSVELAASFRDAFPAQVDATQQARQPATTRWAVLIGINEQMGRVKDNVGSRQDAEELRRSLLDLGWRDDHIVLLADRLATQDNILSAMRWLAAKTTRESVAVFHYSGHSKKWYGQDIDGDGEVTDEGLWPTDDRFIPDSAVVRELAAVDAGYFWINFATCNAEGFNDPGLERAGRLLTFSSGERQKSYENPAWDNSVWGHHLIDEGMLQRAGDTNDDGLVTVEEAFWFAKPRAAKTTDGQRYGRQDAVIIDHAPGDFVLNIPPKPSEPEASEDEDDDGSGTSSAVPCILFCRNDG